MAQPAEAEIVATRANIYVPTGGGIIQFDINHDGIPDFGLSDYRSDAVRHPPEGGYGDWLTVIPAQPGNAIWEVLSSARLSCAAAVPGGARIGAARQFKSHALLMVEREGSITRGDFSICAWAGNHPPYLGLKFLINGEVHYGWARVSAVIEDTVITGFAYETVPNKPILAGATKYAASDGAVSGSDVSPAASSRSLSLGALALGSQNLAMWKRPEDKDIQPAKSR